MAIEKQDINLTHKTATLKDFKNDSTYRGFLNEQVCTLLKNRLKDLQPNAQVLNFTGVKNLDYQIPMKLQPVLDNLFNKGVNQTDTKNRVVIHSLRHTFASHLAINGTPIYTIQKLMNHKDINMTSRYAKLAPDSGRDFVISLYTQ